MAQNNTNVSELGQVRRLMQRIVASQEAFDYNASMAVTEKDVEKIASLARLSLTDEEKQAFARQLTTVLNHFQQMADVPTEGVEPLITPTDMVAEWREDKPHLWADAMEALNGAPERVGNLFKVPPVVGG
jgi:aspartyl-tRNA(Asn)/glutamyl-tRNA(Gln) amidotransferase subunit C